MDAIISGRAGVALLIEDDRIHSFRVEEPRELRPRDPSEVHLLFGDAPDLRVLENVSREDAARQLEREADRADALDLTLLLLDSDLPAEDRAEAASALETLLVVEHVGEYLENILYARSLPGSADLAGAAGLSAAQPRLGALLEGVKSAQPAARAVRRAWDALSSSAFGDEKQRSEFHRLAVEGGIFRELVLAYPDPPTPDCLRRLSQGLQAVHLATLTRWRAALDELGKAPGALNPFESSPVKLVVGDDGHPKMHFGRMRREERHHAPLYDPVSEWREVMAAYFVEPDAEAGPVPQGISTSLLSLDMATRTGGLPRGGIVIFSGPHGTGKTALAALTAASAQEEGVGTVLLDVTSDKPLPVSGPNFLLFQAPEFGGRPFPGEVLRPGSGNAALVWASRIIAAGRAGLVIINDINALRGNPLEYLPQEFDKRRLDADLHTLSLVAAAHDACVVLIEHKESKELGAAADWYTRFVFVDGSSNALDKFVSLRLDFQPDPSLMSFTGTRVRVLLSEKTGDRTTVRAVLLTLNPYGGFLLEEELYDLGVRYNLIVRKGALHYYGADPLGVSREQGLSTLGGRPDLQRRLREELRPLLRLRKVGMGGSLFDSPRARLAPYQPGELNLGGRAGSDAESKPPQPPLFKRDA